MINLRNGGSGTIYEQIEAEFKRLIVSGAMEEGEKLPSVRELSMQLSINPNTIQRAYRELEAEGYIYSVSGKGSFVSDRPKKNADKTKKLMKQLTDIVVEMKYIGVEEERVHHQVSTVYEG